MVSGNCTVSSFTEICGLNLILVQRKCFVLVKVFHTFCVAIRPNILFAAYLILAVRLACGDEEEHVVFLNPTLPSQTSTAVKGPSYKSEVVEAALDSRSPKTCTNPKSSNTSTKARTSRGSFLAKSLRTDCASMFSITRFCIEQGVIRCMLATCLILNLLPLTSFTPCLLLTYSNSILYVIRLGEIGKILCSPDEEPQLCSIVFSVDYE